MEPPSKRRRLSPAEPSDLTDNAELDIARARNDQRLKSLFEGIFEKYGKDFSDVGDEIDLRTGEIIVNKGHVWGMQREDDTGEDPEQNLEGEDDSKLANPGNLDPWREEDGTRVNEQTPTGKAVFESLVAGEMDDEPTDDDDADMDDGRSSVDSLLGDAVAVDDDVTSEFHDKSLSSSVRFPTRTTTTKGTAADPLWQVPDIDVKFSTPKAVKMMSKTELDIPNPRPASPPTAGSLWAIRTPGRPRSTNPKKKSSPAVSSQHKRKRKQPIVRDWSFAQIQHDGSDSDDPLQEDAPSSVSKSISTIRSRGPTSITPSPSKTVPRHDRTEIFFAAGQRDHDSGGLKVSTPSAPDTPDPDESSSQTQEETPTLKTRDQYEGSHFMNGEGAQVIFTPDEVKLIVQMKARFTDSTWGEIVEHLPGRSVTDLHEWDKLHSMRYGGQIDIDSTWSKEDLETLEAFTDKSGIWWKDIQAALPARSRQDIENEMIRLWAREDVPGDRPSSPLAMDADSNPINTGSRPARTPYSDDDDPALRTGDVMSSEQLEDLLNEDFDEMGTDSGISSIHMEANRSTSICGSQRGSPEKRSVSPRKSALW